MPLVGLNELHYAIITKDDETGTTYSTPVKLNGAITANISPSTNSTTLYADNAPSATATALGEIGFEIQTKDLSTQALADLLGNTINGDGVLEKKMTDHAPYVAIGFKAEKDNNKHRFVWLMKGKFMEPNQNYQTKEGSPAFQTPTISGTFIRREFDGRWQVIGDEDDANFIGGANWFTSVYEPNADTTAPTITSIVPADGATAIDPSASVDVVWTFDEVIRSEDVNDGNFFVHNEFSDLIVPGTLTLGSDNKTVTFSSSSFTYATDYTCVVSSNVRDLAGNRLDKQYVTTFTTA